MADKKMSACNRKCVRYKMKLRWEEKKRNGFPWVTVQSPALCLRHH